MEQDSVVFDPFSGEDDHFDEDNSSNVISDFFNASFDTSFESTANQFPTISGGRQGWDSGEPAENEIFCETLGNSSPIEKCKELSENNESAIHLALHEEMVCLYNSVSRVSSCSLKGKIEIDLSTLSKSGTIYLVIKDPRKHIESLLVEGSEHITKLNLEKYSELKYRASNTVIKVEIPSILKRQKIKVVSYTCPRMLSPVPIVVQNKVRVVSEYCRVMVQIRSNPSNESKLSDISVLMAVPAAVIGETVKMSRRGGVWDGMKRIIAWTINDLESGDTLDLQTQFELNEMANKSSADAEKVLNFPVLVRCGSPKGQLSSIDVVATKSANSIIEENSILSRTFRVLYRKV